MKSRNCLTIATALYALLGTIASGQTISDARISEFLASNGNGIEDEDGETSDWIEVLNASGSAGDLGGWYLTDDPANLTKWQIPAIEIGAGDYLIVFASGEDRTDPTSELHTNFRLQSDEGGYLALVRPDGITINSAFENYPEQFQDVSYGRGAGGASAEIFVEEGDAARVLVPSRPIPGWQDLGYDDSAWMPATTGIGYDTRGDYDPFFGQGSAELQAAMFEVNATAYIRVPFTVANAEGISDLALNIRWEDGFIAYLNGVEIHRERAPANAQWNSETDPSAARDEDDAVALDVFPLAAGSVVQGDNVLAIQGLNQRARSTDILISPRLVGMRSDLSSPTDGYLPEPTPGTINGESFDGLTADTKFSVDRGIYETAIDLAITTATPDASIRYTTDGSPPDETFGTLYTGPINISETTVVRALAYRAGFFPTNVDTHTYLFLDDVVDQPEMDPAVTRDRRYAGQLVDSLLSVPTIALSFEGSDIDRTESPISVELLNFESGNKQVNAGAARFGSFVTDFEKRSFRLLFRSRYGASRLEYPLFEDTEYEIAPNDTFDSLDIRAGNHDMLSRGAYLSNRYTDDTMLEMGNLSAHGRFVHIYFNGLYHGRYHLRERWDAAFASDYLPGSEDEYDTINANNSGKQFGSPELQALQDGDLTDWIAMRDLLDTSPTPYRAVKEMLDVPNLIDFMLVWTMGNSESEFRAAGSVENGEGFKFFIKDADGYLRNPDGNHDVTHNGPLNAMAIFRNEGDPDFMTLLADRIHEHFFNGGALTPGRNIARLQHRVDEAMLSHVAEYARRSQIIDQNGSSNNRTPEQWLDYQQNIIDDRFPSLTGDRLDDLRAAGMYPDIIAPVLSQFGGSIAPGSGITMSTNATAIYYTLDGIDPRLQGGAINPLATSAAFGSSNGNSNVTQPIILDGSSQLRARAFDPGTGEWSALTSTFFTINTVPASATNLVISEIHYRPAEPVAAAETAVSTDRDDYEFIELFNIGDQPITLDGVQFTSGITYSFGEESILDPGGRAVLVRDTDAFTARYGSGIPVAGEYSGRLSNGGERLSLDLIGAGVLHDLTYDNQPPWPTAPDGSGPSLVLRNATGNPDESLPENWGVNAIDGGAPGAPDSITSGFALWKTENGVTADDEDNDRDGLSALLEYAFGTSPNDSDGSPLTAGFIEIDGDSYLTVEFPRNAEATDLAIDIQLSDDLITWTDEPGVEIGESSFRTSSPVTDRQFIRIRVTAE